MIDAKTSAVAFRQKWPRIYRKIVNTYGKKYIHDMQGAIALWLKGIAHPVCEVCGSKLTITKKFRSYNADGHRCSLHVNTNTAIDINDLITKCPEHITINQSSVSQFLTKTSMLEFQCKHHGLYKQSVGYFLKGGSCQQCYVTSKSGIPVKSKDTWINQCIKIHNNKYDYSKTVYTTTTADVTILCPTHGAFVQNAGVHSRGHGCPQCARTYVAHVHRISSSSFINKCIKKHGNTYDYTKTEYISILQSKKIIITCKKHGDFMQRPGDHLNGGHGCPKCAREQTTFKSAAEYEIIKFLEESGLQEVQHSDQSLGFELDIYIPSKRLAIEYNGVYWHSSGEKAKDAKTAKQHLFKTQQCEKNNISLLHILDCEWNDPVKKEIWKSTILHKLGLSKNRVFARKCGVVLVPYKTAVEFFNKNHLQGAASSAINIGLQHNGELVALGSFAKSRFNKKDKTAYELIRFASVCNTSVVGGFQKIINEFKKTHHGTLISYANRRWSQGAVYKSSNFVLESVSGPCYYYTDCKTLWHRSVFQKHKLKDVLQVFDPALSEVDNMYNNKYRRIWDCGHLVFKINL